MVRFEFSRGRFAYIFQANISSAFGTLSLTQRKSRNGRNPKTGELMTIPAQTSVRFKVCKTIKDKIRELADKLKELAGPEAITA